MGEGLNPIRPEDVARQEKVDAMHEKYAEANREVQRIMSNDEPTRIRLVGELAADLQSKGTLTENMSDEQIIRSHYLLYHRES